MRMPTHPSDPIAAKAAELRTRYDGRDWMTEAELCSLLGVSRMTAHLLAKRDAWPPRLKLQIRHVRYAITDVAAFILSLSGGGSRSTPPDGQAAAATPVPKTKTGRPRKQRSARARSARARA